MRRMVFQLSVAILTFSPGPVIGGFFRRFQRTSPVAIGYVQSSSLKKILEFGTDFNRSAQ